MSRTFKVATATITVGNALGGLIYVIVPSGKGLGPLDVTVSGEEGTRAAV